MTNFNFDFSNLPAKATRGGAEPELVQVFADLVNAAPRPLGIKEVMAVAEASGIEVPAEATVRNHLNRAVEDDRITKPSRQTYGPAGAEVEGEDDAADEADEAPEADADDELADL